MLYLKCYSFLAELRIWALKKFYSFVSTNWHAYRVPFLLTWVVVLHFIDAIWNLSIIFNYLCILALKNGGRYYCWLIVCHICIVCLFLAHTHWRIVPWNSCDFLIRSFIQPKVYIISVKSEFMVVLLGFGHLPILS